MKKGLLLVLGLALAQVLWAQSTIYSTNSGGHWNDANTWVGGVVPSSTDHVVINGKVLVGTNITCQNLTVNDTLVNDGSGCWNYRHLIITGNVVNNGFVGNAPHYYCGGLRLTLEGNLINNGTWEVHYNYFAGSADQTISTAAGSYLHANNDFIVEKTGGTLLAGSDLYLQSILNLDQKTVLDMQNFALYLQKDGRVLNGTVAQMTDVHFANGAYMGRYNEPITLEGPDMHWYGKAIFGSSKNDDHIINGNLTIHDSLVNGGASCNDGTDRHMIINGDLTNLGVIANEPVYYCGGLKINLNGDLHNEGSFAPYNLYFTGNQPQEISTAVNQPLAATYHIYNQKTGGNILAVSDIYLESPFNLDQKTMLDMQNNALYISGNARVYNGTVTQMTDLHFANGTYMGRYNEPITLEGPDMHWYGKAIFGSSKNDDHIINGNLTIHDSLVNGGASCNDGTDRHMIINGDLTNLGVIANEPVYYCGGLKINLTGNLHNEGTFAPDIFYFTGNQVQTISTAVNQPLAATYRMYNQKTGGTLKVKGDLYVNTRFLLSDEVPLDLQNNPVHLGTDANIGEGIMDQTKDLYFDGDASIGGKVSFTPGDSLWVRGDTVTFHNHGGLLSYVIFEATVVVEDTLTNKAGGTVRATFTKDVINHGSILNKTYSYMEFDQILLGDIYNYGIWEVHTMLFHGNRMRTIQAGDVVYSWGINYDDTLNLIGENTIPKLSAATGASNARVWVRPDASLELTKKYAPNDIINEGYIHWMHDIDTAISDDYGFYNAELNNKVPSLSHQIRIKTYGSQIAPGTENTILRYWQVTNIPLTYSDTLDWLQLSYKNADLNGNQTDSLKVFFSDNAGLSWRVINEGIYHNSSKQYYQVAEAPTVGWYALAGSEIGVSTVRPALTRIESNTGGQSNMTAFLYGAGFDTTAQPYLHSNASGTTIHPEAIQVSPLGDMVVMEMNLTNYPTGQYDVVVELPGDTTMTLPAAFTLTTRMEPAPFVHLSGRERVMLGRYQTYTITYGNTSNIDARAVPIYLAVSEVPGLEVEFLDFDIGISDSSLAKGYGGIDSMSLYFVTDTAFNDNGQVRVYPLYIPRIPANSVNSVRFRIKSNAPVKLQLAMQQPLFVNPFDPACVLGVLGEGIIDISTSAIPGVGCIWSAGKTAFKQTDKYIETKKKSWGSWLYDWTIVAVDCGINLSGAGAFAKASALLFVNMYNYKTAFDECRPNPVRTRDISQVASGDPNAKEGPAGYGAENYIAYPDEMPYVIYFENVPTATAPAQTVTVTDTLDASVYDLSSVQFGSVNFGEEALNLVLGSSHEFERLLDLRPEKDIVLNVEGKFNPTTGIIQWDFTSIDPMTGILTEDPLGGFLPPNNNPPEGEGSVSYFIRLKNGLPHKTVIDNKSTIVFDVNAPITTNTYRNTLDLVAPATNFTQHDMLNDTTVRLTWSGSDDGAGIKAYTLHVVENNNTTYDISFNGSTHSVQFVGKLDSTYHFSIMAEDSVGNTEMLPAQPDLTITFEPTGLEPAPDALQLNIYPNPVRDGVIHLDPSDASVGTMLVEVLGLNGQLVKAERLNSPFTLDVSTLSSGIYLIRVTVDGEQLVRKIVVP